MRDEVRDEVRVVRCEGVVVIEKKLAKAVAQMGHLSGDDTHASDRDM